jgi:cyclic dehypoxanthinyl futalosine synthase
MDRSAIDDASKRFEAFSTAGEAARAAYRPSFTEWRALLRDPEAASPPRRGEAVPPSGSPAAEPFFIESAELLRRADALRRTLHPEGTVSYVVDRNINYSNICTSICSFCAFYRSPGEAGGYVLAHEEIFRKVEETLALGGSGILMQGGLHPDLPLSWYTSLLAELKRRYAIHLHCFSPTEIDGLSEVTGLPSREVLRALRDSGLDSMPGGGAEILVDEIRRKRRSKVNAERWLEIAREAHELGIPTTATMMFGHGEKHRHRLEHLERIRVLQAETGGFLAFIPWNFQPDNTPLGRAYPERLGSEEYLVWLAVSRLYLDRIPNVQVSWLTQGLEVGERGLRAGANDLGSIMIEENVIRPAGASHEATEDLLVGAIRRAGFLPTVRTAAYAPLERVRRRPDGSPRAAVPATAVPARLDSPSSA